MKKLFQLAAACCCMMLMGCPLQTDAPVLGDVVTPIPKWILGRWAELKEGQLSSNTYEVRLIPADSSRVLITGLDASGKADADNIREAVLATVKKQLFISIYDKGDEQNSAGYYHYALAKSKNGDLQLVPLSEYLLASSTSSEALSDYITQHASTSDYLDREATEQFRKQE